MRFFLFFIFIYIFSPIVACAQAINQSALSQGTIFKMAITQSGVYSLSYNDLMAAGISPASINPTHISIFGNGGGMLSQANSAARITDLTENAILVVGEEDENFDPGDYILFYGQGPHIWKYDSTNQSFSHEYNLYSDTSYYFLKIDNETSGKRIQQASPTSPGEVLTAFTERVFYEKDIYNFYESGRYWWSDWFGTILKRTYNFNLDEIVGSSFKVRLAVLGRSFVSTSFDVSFNNTLSDQIVFDVYGWNHYYPYSDTDTRNYTIPVSILPTNNAFSLTLDYDINNLPSPDPRIYFGAFLDYIDISYPRQLKMYGNQTAFRFPEFLEGGDFTIKLPYSGNMPFVWDITNPLNPISLPFTTAQDSLRFNTQGTVLKEFVALEGYNQRKPSSIKQIENQNLHAITTAPELLIVTNPLFKPEAERLANFKRANDKMTVVVATTDQVYNEFSSGKLDVTAIRDFVKFLFDKKTDQDSLRYLLLLGDASYDYKDRISLKENFVPTYQSRESLGQLKSFSSDDYYTFMENSEGEWAEDYSDNSTMDLGVGRLPVKTLAEAKGVVDKIIRYETSPNEQGKWRAKVTLLADDGDTNLHLKDCESQATLIGQESTAISVNKLYLDHFDQILTDSGYKSPDLVRAITKSVENGILILNYVGHSGYTGVMGDVALTAYTALKWKNADRLPLLIAASCGLATYDAPLYNSMGERLVLKPDGGVIGIIAATRESYSTYNKIFNSAIYPYIFKYENRLGDVMRQAKNHSIASIYNRHYSLLGDPSLRLHNPQYKVTIDKINDSTSIDALQLKALSKVRVEGRITDADGIQVSDFNGNINLVLFDKETVEKTKGTGAPVYTYKQRKDVLFDGYATVQNGAFSIQFIIPESAADSIGSGKILLYAASDDKFTDALGSKIDLSTGGTDTAQVTDFTGPEIMAYMDTIAFLPGDTVLSNTTLYAEIQDENGINVSTRDTSGAILAVLNADANNAIVLSSYYKNDINDPKSGLLVYPFKGLANGNYSLQIGASDPYGNRSYKTIDFIVFDTATSFMHPAVTTFLEAKAYPNPFYGKTNIEFEASALNTISVEIYAISGVLVRKIDVSQAGSNKFSWDGTDETGRKLPKGVYICKIRVGANDDIKQKTLMLVMQ